MTDDGELRTAVIKIRSEQIVQIDEVKALLQRLTPHRAISRSEVVRDALDLALPLLAKRQSVDLEPVAGVA